MYGGFRSAQSKFQYTFDIVISHVREQRDRTDALAVPFRFRKAARVHALISIPTMRMSRSEVKARSDSDVLQGCHELVTVQAGQFRENAHDEQMPGMPMIPGGQAERFDAIDLPQTFGVSIRDLGASLDERIQSLQLGNTQNRIHVGHVVLESR